MLSRADSINSVILIEEHAVRLEPKNINRQLEAVFLIKQEIYSIFQTIKDPILAKEKLDWWHDEVIKSRTSGFAPLRLEFELIESYLKNVEEEDLKVIAQWIACYKPMVTRAKITNLLTEYIKPIASSYQQMLAKILKCEISEKLTLMMAANDFLDYMAFFFRYGWFWTKDEEHFNNQLSLLWQELDDLTKKEKDNKLDKKIKFLSQSHEWLISRYRKYKKWEIGRLPKLNLGLARMSFAILSLN